MKFVGVVRVLVESDGFKGQFLGMDWESLGQIRRKQYQTLEIMYSPNIAAKLNTRNIQPDYTVENKSKTKHSLKKLFFLDIFCRTLSKLGGTSAEHNSKHFKSKCNSQE